MEMNFKKNPINKRLKSMLSVDFRRMFTMPLLYIMIAICFVMPILILVMTTMMDGTVSVNPQTGAETVIEGFDSVWQIIGSAGGEGNAMAMDLTSMCNINMLYFLVAVLVCLFVSGDFRSGYAKNLFTVRAKKNDYVVSKTVIGFVGGALMIFAFIIGAMLGGAISGLPFEMVGFDTFGVVMSLISKVFLVSVFVPIYLLMAVIGKHKLWLSVLLSFGVGMFLFNIAPMISPLDSTAINVVLSLVGGALFSIGIGFISNLILKKTSLI